MCSLEQLLPHLPRVFPELTGVTVIDVLVTGRPTIPPVAGTAETPLQVGAGTMGATGGGPSTLIHILLASWA